MKNFWQELKAPFTVLAPMDGVTDVVFREIVSMIGKPDVFFTEFTNSDGIMSPGREAVVESLMFNKSHNPIVAQIWGSNVDNLYQSAKYIKGLGFSGIDINMGCPDRMVMKSGSGGALIKNLSLAKEIIQAVKSGSDGMPVSVKTRIGFNEEQIDEWTSFLLEQDLSAITIHLRTVSELSKVKAQWELMPKIISLRNSISPKTLIIGNGDIVSLDEVEEKYTEYKCEGFMVGRGILANPWIFNKNIKPTAYNKVNLFLDHIRLFNKTWGDSKNPENLKKFCKAYIKNFKGAVKLREEIMNAKKIKEFEEIIAFHKNFLST